MANYYATARSNYFKVKDREAFTEALKGIDVEVVEGDDETVALLDNHPDGAGWPTVRYHEDGDDHDDIDLVQVVAEHLEPGWVAVFVEAGHEKYRYVEGYACAVNHTGETKWVHLHDIYDLARTLGEHVTHASY